MDRRGFFGAAAAGLGGLLVPDLMQPLPMFLRRKPKPTPPPPLPSPTGGTGAITTLPPQPGSVAYGDPLNTSTIAQYAYPGGMVAAGRDDYPDQVYRDISAGGGHVFVYIDPMVWNDFGNYHDLLFNANTINGVAYSAVPEWPGPVPANVTGNLADFRITSVMHTEGKWEAVLEQMVRDNPHMTGFFVDDVGSRSYYPDFDWATFGAGNQQDYRAGAIKLCQTVRTVCDRHGIVALVNGTWNAGSLAAVGGGYPDMNIHGCSLVEGGVVEHHDGELAYWGPYLDPATSQWGDQSTITQGAPMGFVIATASSGTTEFRASKAAWVTAAQPSGDYGGVAPWGTASDRHKTGLPTHVQR